MKRTIALILALVMVLGIVGCGGSTKEPEPTGTPEPTAKELLNKREEQLYNAIIQMTTSDFFEPAKIRILELGDYSNRTIFEPDSASYGPDTIIVRLQGENKVGGTLNHFYMVVIAEGENKTESGQEYIKSVQSLISLASYPGSTIDISEYKQNLMRYSGKVGDYVELNDNYSFRNSTDKFDIGRINRALAEYWENMGF